MKPSLYSGAVAGLMLAVVSSAGHGAVFQNLGDLPGGIFDSIARDISDDGTTVVGASQSSNGQEAFVWHQKIRGKTIGLFFDL